MRWPTKGLVSARVGRPQNVSSVILMTDGVSDPYFETDNGLADLQSGMLRDEIQPKLETQRQSSV